MKHAVLITVYNNFDYLYELVNMFDDDFNIYIHIDKKSSVDKLLLEALYSCGNVSYIEQDYNVNWGSRSHLDAILELCSISIKNSDNYFFHLISGSDILTVDLNYFKSLFEQNVNVNYLEYFPLPTTNWVGGGLDRLIWYHPLDEFDIKTVEGAEKYRLFLQDQFERGERRALPNVSLYGGSTWWSLTRYSISYILLNKNLYGLYDRLNNTFVPEEIYIPTLMLNSPFLNSIVNTNLRYISWKMKNGNCPAILDESDVISIVLSNNVFARKVDRVYSSSLIDCFFELRRKNRKDVLSGIRGKETPRYIKVEIG